MMDKVYSKERFLQLKEGYQQMKAAQRKLWEEIHTIVKEQLFEIGPEPVKISMILPERGAESMQAWDLLQYVNIDKIEITSTMKIRLTGEGEEGMVVINLEELNTDEIFQLSQQLYDIQKKKQEYGLERTGTMSGR